MKGVAQIGKAQEIFDLPLIAVYTSIPIPLLFLCNFIGYLGHGLVADCTICTRSTALPARSKG